ncbi:MAG: hypothetical protein R2823_04255 [Acidimicrobiia bacterium]
MHYSRIVALVGVIVTAVGLFLKAASSAAEALMPSLNEATGGAIPAEFSNVWTGIWDDKPWAAIILAIALVAILGLCFVPPVREALSRMNGLIMVVLGVVVIVVGGFATKSAIDDANDLAEAFAGMAAQGQLDQAYTVSIGLGWVMLIIGGALAAIGGVLALIARPDESAIPGTPA